MHMTKQTHKSTPIKVIFIMFSLQRSQQQSKATCPLEFIFQVPSSLPKRALSSLQVARKQNRERKKQAWMGDSTQNIVLGWGGGRIESYDLRRNPLCSQGNIKRNPASPLFCPTPDPSTSLVVALMACKKKRKEGWLTLLDLVTALQTW